MIELTPQTAVAYARARGLVPSRGVTVRELPGGVSASVVALEWGGSGLVLKQALPRLRVADEWLAKQERTDTEVAAMLLCAGLTPGAVPRVLDHDPQSHVMAVELVPPTRRNWQEEIASGRAHVDAAGWAGETLGTWHRDTARRPELEATFDDHEAFAQLRLDPFHGTVMERRPELAASIAPYLGELRAARRCLVHGDYAKKNMLVGDDGRSVLDFEVAHYGHPVFDLGFFLSFVVLSAVRWPGLEPALRELSQRFLAAYHRTAGDRFAGSPESVVGHTACLVLARTDGKSIALFLDGPSRARAREVGAAMLASPDRGLWGGLDT